MIIKTHPKRAFSLIELLISLIVISCITAAFTPLITKKFATNIGFNGGGGTNIDSPSITTDCSSKYSSDCILCSSSECLSCVKSCPDGQCQDATNCSCKECPTSEFPNCAKFTSTACIQCQKGYRLVEGLCVACTSEKYSDNGKECKYCEAGYWPNSDSTGCQECPEGYICNNGIQVKCSGDTAPVIEEGVLGNNHVCAPCPSGLYCVDGVGKKCSEKWKDCAECTVDACTACEGGTKLVDGKCSESIEDIILKINDFYVTKYNMGDHSKLPIPSTVTMLTAGSSADACESGKCCWQGTTANASYCDSNNGGYNGCTRIICNRAAAQEICARFTLNDENWRLPATTELIEFGSYTLGMASEGLQLCSHTGTSSGNYARCYSKSDCYGAYNRACNPSYVWSRENFTSGNFTITYMYYLISTSWKSITLNGGGTGSVRCVATVSDCTRGQYKNGTTCASCSSKFTHCSACTASECLACDSGYELHPYNKKCFKVVEDAVPVDNLYVTKYNMGDNGLPIPSTVLVMTVGTQCNAQKCCWKGTTANPCQNKNSSSNGGYSGCNRTVCNWYAANEICANYTAAGKTWRLPNYSEMSNWYNYTVSEGASGPQICDDYNSKTTATQCYCNYGNCPGSNDGCRPGFIWAQQYNAYSAYASFLNYGGWYYPHSSRDKTYAYSVRCVTAIDYS